MATIVFLPGVLQTAQVFWHQVNVMSSDHTVMVFPTHQDERIEDIAHRVTATVGGAFVVVGLGMGSVVALEIQRIAKDRVSRLCLMSATGMAETPEGIAEKDLTLVSLRGGRFHDLLPAQLGFAKLADTQVKTDVVAQATSMAQAIGPNGLEHQLRAMQRRRDQQATLRKIKCPTLCLSGDSDQMVDPKRMAFMAELIPPAQLVSVEHASHLLTLEQPEAVTNALKDFLA